VKDNKWKRNIKIEQYYICLVCGRKGTDQTLNIHHKKAKRNGGKSNRENVVAWHATCHRRYHEKYGNKESNDHGYPLRRKS